jgi:hypothetical protein
MCSWQNVRKLTMDRLDVCIDIGYLITVDSTYNAIDGTVL